jgi:hypothetical protein
MLLRAVILTLITSFGLGGLGMPMALRISALDEAIQSEAKRTILLKHHQYLSSRMMVYLKRIPKAGNMDWWREYIIARSRDATLDVRQWNPSFVGGKQGRIGLMHGVFFNIVFNASYRDFVRFVGRLENAEDTVHISRLSLSRNARKGNIGGTITIDIITNEAPPKQAAAFQKAKSRPAAASSQDAEDKPAGPAAQTAAGAQPDEGPGKSSKTKPEAKDQNDAP